MDELVSRFNILFYLVIFVFFVDELPLWDKGSNVNGHSYTQTKGPGCRGLLFALLIET